MREQAHIEVGKEEPQHIGLTGLPVEDLLLRLLLGHEQHELDAVQWLRDMLGEHAPPRARHHARAATARWPSSLHDSIRARWRRAPPMTACH